jgi:hypothetical protein
MRSSRLTNKLTTCSITPRSGHVFVEELSRNPRCDAYEHIYEEAKLALLQHDTNAAVMLFERCPPSYRNTERYLNQCKLFSDLCRTGVLQRDQTTSLRETLSAIVCETKESLVVSKYSELLNDMGYTARSFEIMSLRDLPEMFDRVHFAEGYRALIQAHFEKRSDLCTLVVFRITRALEHCSGLHWCAAKGCEYLVLSSTRKRNDHGHVEKEKECVQVEASNDEETAH